MEYLDILDENGQPTGTTKAKDEVQRDGDWHKSVHVSVVNAEGEFLVQQRSLQKPSWPGLWEGPSGGHVEAGEDSLTAIRREAEEEIGLSLKPEEIEYLFTVKDQAVTNNGAFIENEFVDVYLVQREVDIASLRLQPEEVAAVRWIPYQELERIIAAKDPAYLDHDEYPQLFEVLRARYP